MKAEIICVGSELLSGLISNTNGGYLSRRLSENGVTVLARRAIPDDKTLIAEAVLEALARCELVICCGGLGPTADDLTREAVAGALERPMTLNRGWLQKLESFFKDRGLQMPESNRKQALVIKGGWLIENSRGTAPGMIVEHGGGTVILLPGPPAELEPMFEEQVLPYIRQIGAADKELIITRILKCIGIGESMLEERIRPLDEWHNPALSLIARGNEVYLQLRAQGEPDCAGKLLDEAEKKLRSVIGPHIYGRGEESLPGLVAALLTKGKMTLAVAESCTGGLMADTITDIPGSSEFFKGSLVAYHAQIKTDILQVDSEILKQEGTVSEPVATGMAKGARRFFSADWGVGITGIAGPGRDEKGRPPGLVYVAVQGNGLNNCRRFKFPGSRRAIKERAVQSALTMLWRMILENERSKEPGSP
jgi:nicotinamide-nucleotide amidase